MIPKVCEPILKVDKCDINGWLIWGMDKEGEQGKRYLHRGCHYEVRGKPGAVEIPRNP